MSSSRRVTSICCPLRCVTVGSAVLKIRLVDPDNRIGDMYRPLLHVLIDACEDVALGFGIRRHALDYSSLVDAAMMTARPKENWLRAHDFGHLTWNTHGLPERLVLQEMAHSSTTRLEAFCRAYNISLVFEPFPRIVANKNERSIASIIREVEFRATSSLGLAATSWELERLVARVLITRNEVSAEYRHARNARLIARSMQS